VIRGSPGIWKDLARYWTYLEFPGRVVQTELRWPEMTGLLYGVDLKITVNLFGGLKRLAYLYILFINNKNQIL